MRIELPGGVAVNMFKAVNTARATDKMRLALTAVNWEIVGGVHTFTATDSYRLHAVSIPDLTATYSDSVVLSGYVIDAVKNCAKAVGKGGNVVLEIGEKFDAKYCDVYGTHVVGGVIDTNIVQCLSIEYPSCRSIIDGATDIELPALFNGKYLGDLVDAATLWAGKDSPVIVESVHARKPSHIISNNDFGTFTGVVMPQRGGK